MNNFKKIEEQALADFKERTKRYEDWLMSLRLRAGTGKGFINHIKQEEVMKKYKYIGELPSVFTSVTGKEFKIRHGDIIMTNDGRNFVTEDRHIFSFSTERFSEIFERLYTDDEKAYYRELHIKAAMSAMQGILSNPYMTPASVVKNAIAYADEFIREIQECEWNPGK